MSSKGASNRYPTGARAMHGKAGSHINFEWAKDFNKKTLNQHYTDHGKNMGFESKQSYKQHAIKFANTIDKKNCVSFIDNKTKSTYKYNKNKNELAIITKDGYVVTYFKPKEGYNYYKKQLKQKNGGNRYE